MLPETASRPMEKVSVDLYDLKGKTFVVMVDRYSGLPFTKQLSSLNTEALWKTLMGWFYQFGYPEEIKSDNGPQFRGPFEKCCESIGASHKTSSPFHPASNGLAEAGVKSVKRLLQKTGGADGQSFRSALLEWSCTPRADGFSPAEAFHGRRLRTKLPSARSLEFDRDGFETARAEYRDRMVQSARGRPLKPLALGQKVHVQDVTEKSWSFGTGVVTEALPNGRSYRVKTEAGVFRRNRRHLRPAPETVPRTHETVPLPAALSPSTPSLPRRSERIRKKRVSFVKGS